MMENCIMSKLTLQQRRAIYERFTPENYRNARIIEILHEQQQELDIQIGIGRYRLSMIQDQMRDMAMRLLWCTAVPLTLEPGYRMGRMLALWWLT